MKYKPAPPNQLSVFDPCDGDPTRPERIFEGFHKGDKISVISGQYKGRTGVYFKNCSNAFPEYCRVFFDLRGRERIQKYQMILKSDLKVTG